DAIRRLIIQPDMLEERAAIGDKGIMDALDGRRQALSPRIELQPSLNVDSVTWPFDPDHPIRLHQVAGCDAEIVKDAPRIRQQFAPAACCNEDTGADALAQ